MMTNILILVFLPQIQGQGFLEVTLMVWGGWLSALMLSNCCGFRVIGGFLWGRGGSPCQRLAFQAHFIQARWIKLTNMESGFRSQVTLPLDYDHDYMAIPLKLSFIQGVTYIVHILLFIYNYHIDAIAAGWEHNAIQKYKTTKIQR